jgi:adenylyltransferase/sulfurtransferase
MKAISPTEVQAQAANANLILIDIREPYEYQSCQIEALKIPMAEFAARFSEFSKEQSLVLMCQSGKRAEALANFIETEFAAENIYVLSGGLNAYISEVAPHLTCE